MKIKIFLSVILLLLVSFKSFAASDGKGEIQLSEQSVNSFINYITGNTSKNSKSLLNKPMSFWVTIDGMGHSWWYCKHSVCRDNSVEEKKACENKMVRVAADLLKVDMLVGEMELIQKEKRLNLVAK